MVVLSEMSVGMSICLVCVCAPPLLGILPVGAFMHLFAPETVYPSIQSLIPVPSLPPFISPTSPLLLLQIVQSTRIDRSTNPKNYTSANSLPSLPFVTTSHHKLLLLLLLQSSLPSVPLEKVARSVP